MALQQPCSRKMLTELIIAKKGTLLGVLQNAQEIGGLGSITENTQIILSEEILYYRSMRY